MKKKTCDNLPFRFQHHMVPLSAVPCLSYQLALDEEAGVEVPSLAGKKEIPFWQYQNETKVQLPKRLLFLPGNQVPFCPCQNELRKTKVSCQNGYFLFQGTIRPITIRRPRNATKESAAASVVSKKNSSRKRGEEKAKVSKTPPPKARAPSQSVRCSKSPRPKGKRWRSSAENSPCIRRNCASIARRNLSSRSWSKNVSRIGTRGKSLQRTSGGKASRPPSRPGKGNSKRNLKTNNNQKVNSKAISSRAVVV